MRDAEWVRGAGVSERENKAVVIPFTDWNLCPFVTVKKVAIVSLSRSSCVLLVPLVLQATHTLLNTMCHYYFDASTQRETSDQSTHPDIKSLSIVLRCPLDLEDEQAVGPVELGRLSTMTDRGRIKLYRCLNQTTFEAAFLSVHEIYYVVRRKQTD